MTKRRPLKENQFYHVTMHGHNRLPIFGTHTDQLAFFRTLHRVYERFPFTLLAYCVMPNHYHLLIRSESVELSKIMGSINLRYSLSYKQRHGHKGTLYDRRYFSDPTITSRSLLNTSFYIHLNPVNTQSPIVTSPELYLYSSYRYFYYPDLEVPPFLDKDLLFTHLPDSLYKNTEAYENFMNKFVHKKKKSTRQYYLTRRPLKK